MGMELREMSPWALPTRRKPQTSAGALVPQDPNGRDAFPFWKESKGRFGKPIQYEGGWQAHLDRPELPMPGVWDGPRPPLSEEGQRPGECRGTDTSREQRPLSERPPLSGQAQGQSLPVPID